MTVTTIIGAQWGDEGKGKITDYLADNSKVVARSQGGNNAGHTIVIDGKKYKLHLLPSGILRKDIVNVVGNGVVVNPDVLLKELANLDGERGQLFISDRAHVIMPYHKLMLDEKTAKMFEDYIPIGGVPVITTLILDIINASSLC